MRIILIEDEIELANILKKGLEENGYCVDIAYEGEEGLYMAQNFQADLIILDINLPSISGFNILESIRKKGKTIPVIILTARDSIEDKIYGLDSGADDYLTKPFDFEELLARIRVLLRRNVNISESLIKIGDLEIDTASHEVRRGGTLISLTTKEYNLLEYLAYNRDTALKRSEITEHIYSEEFDKDSNIIDVYINYLRNKVDKGYKNKLIHTLRGTGYMLRDKLEKL